MTLHETQCRTRKNQHAQFPQVALRITKEQASCRPEPLQGKRTKRCELLAKHTCDSELARAVEKVALVVSQARSCKRNVAISSSLRLQTCHVQRLHRSTFALGQSKHAQQSPHGVFGEARLGADIWSQVLSRTLGNRHLSSCRTVDVSNFPRTTSGTQPFACRAVSYQFCLHLQ